MQSFDKIVGHENIIEHLKNAIKKNKVSHAYLFNGEEGMGKRTLATEFAKLLQCEEGGDYACNKCISCMQHASGNNPDLIWVTHEKASISVEDIRQQVNGDVFIKPYKSKYKIYIIEAAEKMTEAAQNALLKTIEEPPEYVIIMLLTNNNSNMLQTIISRCVVLNLKPVDKEAIKEFLMVVHQVPDYMADMAAGFSGGNVGKAIKYAFSKDFERLKEDVLHILRYIDEMQLHEVILGLKEITAEKAPLEDNIDLMILWYRDILMLKATNDPDLLLYKNEFKFIRKYANTISYEGIDNIINAMEKAKVRLKANVNTDIALELMLLSIKENSNG